MQHVWIHRTHKFVAGHPRICQTSIFAPKHLHITSACGDRTPLNLLCAAPANQDNIQRSSTDSACLVKNNVVSSSCQMSSTDSMHTRSCKSDVTLLNLMHSCPINPRYVLVQECPLGTLLFGNGLCAPVRPELC